jgi:Crp-like helix-turn-helix domain
VRELYEGGNRLLDALSPAQRAAVAVDLQVLAVDRREGGSEPGESFGHIDFPLSAVYSVIAMARNGDVAEVGSIGREGFVPAQVALGADHAWRTTFCQIPGDVARMRVEPFLEAIDTHRRLAMLVERNIEARLFVSEQLTACNLLHALVERCARWLLTMRDHLGRDEFPLTHEFLAAMLGVRRAGVTQAAGTLHAEGAIVYRRGQVRIVDADRLNDLACECYQATRDMQEHALRGEVLA